MTTEDVTTTDKKMVFVSMSLLLPPPSLGHGVPVGWDVVGISVVVLVMFDTSIIL